MAWDKTLPTRTTKIRVSTAPMTGNWAAIEDWSSVDHYGLTHALSGRHVPGSPLWAINTTSGLNALTSCVACAAAFDTTLKTLKYNNGVNWVDLGGPAPSGTKMLFYADTAPTGWTLLIVDKNVNPVDGYSAVISKGSATGGMEGGLPLSGGTWTEPNHTHTSLGHALTIAEMSEHGHYITDCGMFDGGNDDVGNSVTPHGTDTTSANVSIKSEGSNGEHTSIYLASGTQASWKPEMYNCILCEKD